MLRRDPVGRFGPVAAVAAVALVSLLALLPDALLPSVEFNDRILHRALADYAAEHAGAVWRFDHWYPNIATGFPVFAHYQHLSHVVSGWVVALLPGEPDAGRVYLVLWAVVLSLVPLSIWLSLRKLGFAGWPAAFPALLFPLVRAQPYFGIGWESSSFLGSGLVPQAWATLFVFPALAWGWTALRRGGGAWRAGAWLCACALSHVVFGYIAAGSLALAALLPGGEARLGRRLGRLAGIAGATLLGCGYFVVPLWLGSSEVLQSRYEPLWKWDSIGAGGALSQLVSGRMFDGGQPAVLTVAVVACLGWLAWRAWRQRDPLSGWLVGGFLMWLVLFFGRPTLGPLVDLLPLADGLHLHRLVAGAQIFGLLAAGVGLAALIALPARRTWRAGLLILLLAALTPAVLQRGAFMAESRRAALAGRAATEAAREFQRLVEHLRGLPAGRVYAGMHNDWGREFKLQGAPVYQQLQAAGFDMVTFLYIAMAKPGEWQVRVDFGRLDNLRAYAVRWLVLPAGRRAPGFALPRFRAGRFALYEVPGSGYCAWGSLDPAPWELAGETRRERWESAFQEGRDWFRRGGTASGVWRVFPGAAVPSRNPRGGPPGRVREERLLPNRLEATTSAPADGWLIAKATAHRGWSARLEDGRDLPITRVLPGFMAVPVPAGEHRVVFRYAPPGWKRPACYLGLSALLLGALVERRRRGR